MFSIEAWAREQAEVAYGDFLAWVYGQEDMARILDDLSVVDAALTLDGPMLWPMAREAVARLVEVARRYEPEGPLVALFEGLAVTWLAQGGDGHG